MTTVVQDEGFDDGKRQKERGHKRQVWERERLRERKNNETLDIYDGFIKIVFEHLISMKIL